MSRKWSILQTFWHVKPAQSILVQDKRGIARNRIQAFCTYLRLVIGSFSLYESRNVYARPFFRVPPHQLFSFTPGTAVRPRTGAIVNNSAIIRPREAPAVTKIISGFTCVGLVHAIAAKNSGINPAAACRRSIGFQFRETIHLRAMMGLAVSIDAE